MNMRLSIISIIATIFLAACAGNPPDQSELKIAAIPSQPSQSEAESKIRQYFNGTLKDPGSLILECKPVRKGWARQGYLTTRHIGWLVPCKANAKNSYGGYVGATSYVFIFTSQGMKWVDGRTPETDTDFVQYME
jgi:hypothetical protein